MKKIILSFIMCVCAFISNAQVWKEISYQEDELLGYSGGTTIMYTDENGNTFECGLINNGKSFRCDISNNSRKQFNWSSVNGTSKLIKMTHGVVGLYDINNKLIKKWNENFVVPDNTAANVCRPFKWRKIMKYINENQGYVKVIISVYEDNDFRMTIPCINNK